MPKEPENQFALFIIIIAAALVAVFVLGLQFGG
jgi:hypothetical protein